MIDDLEGSKRSGTFTIAAGKEVYGELTFKGPKTSLYLQDRELFSTSESITGILHDLTKVSLIHCSKSLFPGSVIRGNEMYYFADIFPHFVIYGDHHITPAEKAIAEVHFLIDDASTLFYDFDAFGSVIDAQPFIEQIAHANNVGREIVTGPNPAILYFTGKHEIFTADTVLGRISASHNLSRNLV